MVILTFGSNLDKLHSWILWLASMHAISQIAEPGTRTPAPDLLDPWVIVAARDSLTGNGDPVLVAAVLECDSDCAWVRLDVVELLAVCIAEEQEVRSRTLGDCHRTVDWSYARTKSAHEANLELIANAVKVLELLLG